MAAYLPNFFAPLWHPGGLAPELLSDTIRSPSTDRPPATAAQTSPVLYAPRLRCKKSVDISGAMDPSLQIQRPMPASPPQITLVLRRMVTFRPTPEGVLFGVPRVPHPFASFAKGWAHHLPQAAWEFSSTTGPDPQA